MIRRAFVLVALFALFTVSASAATRSWTGAVNNLMSVGGNWSEGTPPVDGDDLLFPNVFMAPGPQNDIVGLDVGSITGDPNRHYFITGNALTVAGGITGNFGLDLPVTLTASQTFSGVGIIDNVNLNGHTLTVASASVGTGGSITGAGNVIIPSGRSLDVAGGGSVTFTGTLTNHGALSVTGTVNGSTLVNDGGIVGIGIIPVTTMTGGTISPGFGSGPDRIGVLTMGTLTFNGGTYAADTTGVHSDRLNVIGNVVLTNATLAVALDGAVPAPGSSLVIVANDGADPVTGIFNGLPEGAAIVVAGVTYTITYTGGDGNDIALFVQSAPKTWTGAVNNLMSVGGNWNDGVPPVDGDDVAFPEVLFITNPFNDIVGLDLGSITGDPNRHYEFTGNPFTVAGGITGAFTLDLPVTLAASQTFSGLIIISDNLNLNGHTLTLGSARVGAGGSITGAGNVTILAGGSLEVTGGGGSVTFTGTLTNHGSLSVTGTVNGSTLINDGGIVGIGIIPVTTMTGGAISPGFGSGPDRIGVLTMGTLTFNGGTFNADVTGVHSDRLNVIGNVVLTNATLAVSVDGAVPSPGSSLVIVANDGADPVTGIFNGLPQGAMFSVDGITFQITYLGGDGNDVALVVQSAPKSWTGAVNNLMSVGGNWNDGVPPVDGDDLTFPDVFMAPSPVNDLVGLDLGSITGDPNRHYGFTGNPFTVAGGITGGFTLDLPVTLTASQTFSGLVIISDNLNLNGHTLTVGSVRVGAGGSITGSGNVTIPAGGSLEVTGGGGSVTFTGTLTNHGLLSVTGTVNGSTLISDGGIVGIGIIPVTTMTGGTISPGFGDDVNRIGVLTMGTLTFNAGTYEVHTTGQHIDRLNVIGNVILTNATLQLEQSGAVPAPGSELIFVANDGADPVTGTFNGLPEGAIITIGTITFQITYTGGDGNDVALLVVTETETALTASDLNPEAGEPVTLTATVTSDGGTPTGTVVFREGATILATAPLNAQGVATATVVLPGGAHTIVAEYQGDGAFASSVSPPITINSQHAEAIPTLGELALMLFALLIGLAGVLVMRHA